MACLRRVRIERSKCILQTRDEPHFMSFNEIVATLNRQGHKLSFKQVPNEVFVTLFPGAAEVAATFSYFQAHTYLGSDSSDRIALASKMAGRQPSKFATWARENFPAQKYGGTAADLENAST